jgi:hypothetical protein
LPLRYEANATTVLAVGAMGRKALRPGDGDLKDTERTACSIDSDSCYGMVLYSTFVQYTATATYERTALQPERTEQ